MTCLQGFCLVEIATMPMSTWKHFLHSATHDYTPKALFERLWLMLLHHRPLTLSLRGVHQLVLDRPLSLWGVVIHQVRFFSQSSFKPSSITTGLSEFAECQGHSAKPNLHSAKALPSAALGKKRVGKDVFAECLLSGTRQSLCRVPTLGKVGTEKKPEKNGNFFFNWWRPPPVSAHPSPSFFA